MKIYRPFVYLCTWWFWSFLPLLKLKQRICELSQRLHQRNRESRCNHCQILEVSVDHVMAMNFATRRNILFCPKWNNERITLPEHSVFSRAELCCSWRKQNLGLEGRCTCTFHLFCSWTTSWKPTGRFIKGKRINWFWKVSLWPKILLY